MPAVLAVLLTHPHSNAPLNQDYWLIRGHVHVYKQPPLLYLCPAIRSMSDLVSKRPLSTVLTLRL